MADDRHESGPQGSNIDAATFARWCEAYGGDTRRWPKSAGPEAEGREGPLDEAARRTLAEARALDAVLNRGAAARTGTGPLTDRIMAAIAQEATPTTEARREAEVPVDAGSNVVAFPGQRAGAPRRAQSELSPARSWRPAARAGGLPAALIAASLLLGVALGTNQALLPYVDEIASGIGFVKAEQVADAEGFFDTAADDLL